MAYNSSFNPDALPAHAEPDQAAQILAQQSNQRTPSRPHSDSNATISSQYEHKPPPPIPQNPQHTQSVPIPQSQQHTQQQYRPHHSPNNSHLSSSYNSSNGVSSPPPPQIPPDLQYNHPQYRRHSPTNPHLGPSYNPNNRVPSPTVQNHHYANPPQYVNQPYQPPARSPPPTHTSYPPLGSANPPYQQPSHTAPPQRSSLPPPGSGDPSLWPLFQAVDKRGTGQLTEIELSMALVNGDYTSFDPQTVKMMIRMFDADRSGTIGFEEFCGLWGFLAAWRTLFTRFDEDSSGTISYDEYSKALTSFGYHLSTKFVTILYRMYDRKGTNAMSFDIFVQSCIGLKRMTDVFKKYDTDRDGYITLSFEEFLTEILQQR